MNLTGTYGVTARPEKQKLYTVNEMAMLLDCSQMQIVNITNYYHIPCEVVVHRTNFFTYDAFRLIKEHYEARCDKLRQKAIADMADKAPEEVARLEDHSLVTNPRWLELNEWPETVPVCFEE